MDPELLLAIETSSRHASVALSRGGMMLGMRDIEPVVPGAAAQAAAAGLLPAAQAVLAEHERHVRDVGIVAFSHGPGSFTGLRVAATVARMLHAITGCRVVAVPTLEAISRNARALPSPPERVAVMLDAKRGDVYGASYALLDPVGRDDPSALSIATIRRPAAWLASLPPPVWVMGEGVAKHAESCATAGAAIIDAAYWTPRAESVAAIGWRMACAGAFCPPERIIPLYVRPPECEEVYEQRRAAAKARRRE